MPGGQTNPVFPISYTISLQNSLFVYYLIKENYVLYIYCLTTLINLRILANVKVMPLYQIRINWKCIFGSMFDFLLLVIMCVTQIMYLVSAVATKQNYANSNTQRTDIVFEYNNIKNMTCLSEEIFIYFVIIKGPYLFLISFIFIWYSPIYLLVFSYQSFPCSLEPILLKKEAY